MNNKIARACLPPYSEYWSYGPYLAKTSNRLNINLLTNNSKIKTMTYARYLVSVHFDIILPPTEDVDHIDGNKQNNSIDNLQVLSKKENGSKLKQDLWITNSRTLLKMQCPHCTTTFTIDRRKSHIGKKQGFNTFCSKKCSYHSKKYLEHIQVFEEILSIRKEPHTYSFTEPWETWSVPMRLKGVEPLTLPD